MRPEAWPPTLQSTRPLLRDSAQVQEAIAAIFGRSSRFRVYLDETCAPDDWRSPAFTAKVREAPYNKYGAEIALPQALDQSPFVTSRWQRANASIVVNFVYEFGGAIRALEACRRLLRRRSPAWRASNGSRHFFIATQDFGPCSLDGQLVHPWFLTHHVIAVHGELDGHHMHHSTAPDLPCFDSQKDVSIPPAIVVDRSEWTAAARHVDPSQDGQRRNLTIFFSGAGILSRGKREGRWLLLKAFGGHWDPQMRVVRSIARAEMLEGMSRAKYCPVFGGNSPWTTRLIEAVFSSCVPVIISTWLPPFSRLLRWEQFSVRITTLADIPRLKAILLQQDYARLVSNLPLAQAALWYRLGSYAGDDALPMLLVEMSLALTAAQADPLKARADRIVGLPLEDAVIYDKDEMPARWQQEHGAGTGTHLSHLIEQSRNRRWQLFKGGVTIITRRPAGVSATRCVPYWGIQHSCRGNDPYDDYELATATRNQSDHTHCGYLQSAMCVPVPAKRKDHEKVRDSLVLHLPYQYVANQTWGRLGPNFTHDGRAEATAMQVDLELRNQGLL